MRTVALYGLKREMVFSTLRTCADRTTIPPIRSDPCARCSRLNHSHAAPAGSEPRLFIAAVTGHSFADIIVFAGLPNRICPLSVCRRRAMAGNHYKPPQATLFDASSEAGGLTEGLDVRL